MKIMILADVHQRMLVNPLRHRRTIRGLKKAFSEIDFDLAVFLGDLIHGPDYRDNKERFEKDLREALDTTAGKPFAFVFGNHDDECAMTKSEILDIISSYPNSLTDGENYVLHMNGETLVFIDSGSYYDGEESNYEVVKPEVSGWIKQQIDGEKAIAFQHIIIPDIYSLLEKGNGEKKFPHGRCNYRFRDGVEHAGHLYESPCPPDINTGELQILAPNLKGMVFGHDHTNDFECYLEGVKLIQCQASGVNCYEYPQRPTVRLLDTETMTTRKIRI